MQLHHYISDTLDSQVFHKITDKIIGQSSEEAMKLIKVIYQVINEFDASVKKREKLLSEKKSDSYMSEFKKQLNLQIED